MNEQQNRGYIYKPHDISHKIFGSTNAIGGNPLNYLADWTKWLPASDQQQNIGIEPEDCTSEGTLGAVEILANMLFADTREWSKRFLAYVSGTTQEGNDPMSVANALASTQP